MARRWFTKRQPTTWGSSPWQQVESPLGWRGVEPVWPIWFRCVMKRQDRLAFAAEIDQGLAAAERGFRGVEEAEDQGFGFGSVDRSVGLFFGPAGAGDEEEFGVGTDGLLVGLRRALAGHGGAGGGRGDRDEIRRRLRRKGRPKARSSRNRGGRTRAAALRVRTASMRWR